MNSKSNTLGWTPLHTAAFNKHATCVRVLVSGGAEVNIKNNDGETPLKIAVDNNCDEIATFLRHSGGVE